MVSEQIHVIRTKAQKWRFVCPNSKDDPDPHHDWRLWDGYFRCETCHLQLQNGEEPDTDPFFDELWDQSEEELVPRERIEIEHSEIKRPKTA